MAKIIAAVNQKGGVGKTTTVVNLSSAVALLGHKVLMVDLDPQGNATSGVGIAKNGLAFSAYDVLIGTAKPEQVVLHTEFSNLDIIPTSMQMAGAEIELVEIPRRENRLKAALAALRDQYDYIFIDCPPSLGLRTLTALGATDTLLGPIQGEFLRWKVWHS
jgi:chromosome partitioning protein